MALSKIRNDSLADTAVHGRRNLIINGAMQVSQRETSTDKNSHTGSAFFTVDRFELQGVHPSIDVTVEQSTDTPDSSKFKNSLKITIDSGASSYPATTTDHFRFRHKIEAQNCTHLEGVECTLSFWAKSSIAAQYDVALFAQDSTNNHQVLPYDINTANTWEYKTLTFTGPSTINDDNGLGLDVQFQLARSGTSYRTSSTNVWGSTKLSSSDSSDTLIKTDGATFQITGVQLEVGDTATPFEHRSYGEELALCQRYYQRIDSYTWLHSITTSNSGYRRTTFPYPVTMRSTPTITYSLSGTYTSDGTQYIDETQFGLYANGVADAGFIRTNGNTEMDAEL